MPCDPLRDLRAWQERLERMSAQHGSAWAPPMDVYETADRYVVTAELPGLTREDVDLAVQDGQLTIRGARPAGAAETATRHYHQVERGHGRFRRVFQFVEPIDAGAIAADLREGILTITLPKTAPPPPRRIDVR